MNETYCSIIPSQHFVNINAYTNLIEIHKLIHKIFEHKKILTSIKGHNAVQNRQKKKKKKKKNAIPNHSSLISMSMQNLKKIGQNLLGQDVGSDCISSLSLLIFLHLLKLESGNEALTDGRMDTRTVRRV